MSDTNKTGRKANAGNSLRAVFLTIILIAIAVLGIFIGIYLPMISAAPDPTAFKRSSLMRTTIIGSGGDTHSTEARFSIEVSNDYEGSIDTAAIFSVLEQSLAKLDFDKIAAQDGLTYVKKTLMDALIASNAQGYAAVVNIYVTDFLTDFTFGWDTDPNNTNIMDAFRGLFKNIK